MVLLHIGGVYIDTDVVMIKPVLDLSHMTSDKTGKLIPVFGEDTSYSLANGFIMSPPNNIFLRVILVITIRRLTLSVSVKNQARLNHYTQNPFPL